MTETQNCMIYLLRCAVNGLTPDTSRLSLADMEELCELAKFHKVGAAVSIALERAGIKYDDLYIVYKKSIQRNILFDVERAAILAEFEARGIWYLPLKGILLKDIYSENGMREMNDNDILFDPERREDVKEIMLARGYSCDSFGFTNHDIYTKLPVMNFEMHAALFNGAQYEKFYAYYSNIERIMIKDGVSDFGYRLSDEDFYVYMTAHEWKHFDKSGTGIRSLLDCYVYLTEKNGTLDAEYIKQQLRELGIEDYEKERTALAMKLFSPGSSAKLSADEESRLEYYMKSGVYGIVENDIRKKLDEQSKFSFVVHSLFPPLLYMRESVSFVDKYPWLYPVGVMWRWGRILTRYRKYLARVIKAVGEYGKHEE